MMKILVFASGRGSNARAIFNAIKDATLSNVEVLALVSDIADAPALKIAEEFGIKAVFIDPLRKGARFTEESEKHYIEFVEQHNPDLIVLAGFMRILPETFVSKFGLKTINLHPSLLPAYKGLDPIKRAFEANEKQSGCSIHWVSNELDGGAIIAQSPVDILSTDTLETLEEKVHKAEHKLMVEVIGNLSKNFS
ncbi:MAG: phosphoribosylglycinamide formyltransferase [Verrucomicrobiaceae bacterium]|nr:phosphoribosylglycinamide formyltransferase [Verrucomicrobiaceae bacterium]